MPRYPEDRYWSGQGRRSATPPPSSRRRDVRDRLGPRVRGPDVDWRAAEHRRRDSSGSRGSSGHATAEPADYGRRLSPSSGGHSSPPSSSWRTDTAGCFQPRQQPRRRPTSPRPPSPRLRSSRFQPRPATRRVDPQEDLNTMLDALRRERRRNLNSRGASDTIHRAEQLAAALAPIPYHSRHSEQVCMALESYEELLQRLASHEVTDRPRRRRRSRGRWTD